MSAPMLPSRLDAETATVRGELTRIDSKAAMLLALGATALSGGLAVLGTGHLSGRAVAAGWVAAGLVAGGVLVLGASVWPRLAGGFGFMAWAAATGTDDLVRLMAASQRHYRVWELWQLSRAVRAKYMRIRCGMALMGLGLATAIVTAVLAGQS